MNQIEPIDRIGYILLVFSSFFVDDESPYFVSYYSFCNHGLFLSFQDWRYLFVNRSRLGNIRSSLYFFEELERFHSTAMWCSVLHLMDAGDSGRNKVISLFLTIYSSCFVIRVPLWAIWAGGSLYLYKPGRIIAVNELVWQDTENPVQTELISLRMWFDCHAMADVAVTVRVRQVRLTAILP